MTFAHCPICQKKTGAKKMKRVASLIPFDGFILRQGCSALDSLIQLLNKYPDFYQWACDDCIDAKRAILANPKKQFFTFKYPWDVARPFLTYQDKKFSCKDCKQKFTFTKEEQQHWYEKLSFVVYAKPIHCKECGSELRKAKNLNTELSELLKEGKPRDKNKLIRISEIYGEMGKEEKQKMYWRAAQKIR